MISVFNIDLTQWYMKNIALWDGEKYEFNPMGEYTRPKQSKNKVITFQIVAVFGLTALLLALFYYGEAKIIEFSLYY